MPRIRFAILTLLMLSSCAPLELQSQTAPDTCWVEGYLFGNDMKVARAGVVVIKRIEKPGYLFTWRPSAEAKADSTGFVRIPLPRGSTAFLYSQHLYSISRDQTNGTPVPIPNAPTARLENLPLAASVPTSHMVAVPLLQVKGSGDSANVHTLEIEGADLTFLTSGTATLSVATPSNPRQPLFLDTTKGSVVWLSGRHRGTVTFTEGSDTLRGHGTYWATGAQQERGNYTWKVEAPDSIYYIDEVIDDTTATLSFNINAPEWGRYIYTRPTVTVPYDNGSPREYGDAAMVYGMGAKATGFQSMAFGYNAHATGMQSVAIGGEWIKAEGTRSLGLMGSANGNYSISLRGNAQADYSTAIASGFAKAEQAMAIGGTASGYASITLVTSTSARATSVGSGGTGRVGSLHALKSSRMSTIATERCTTRPRGNECTTDYISRH